MKKKSFIASFLICCLSFTLLVRQSEALPVQESDDPDGLADNAAHRLSVHRAISDEASWWSWEKSSQLIEEPATRILGEFCYDSLIKEMNYNDLGCVKLALSKVLGFGIVLGGAIIKIPQIIIILKHRSVQGLSQLSFLLETCAYLIVLIYNVRHNNPFSTFGEGVFMTLQNILISYLIIHYSSNSKTANNNCMSDAGHSHHYPSRQVLYSTTSTQSAKPSLRMNGVTFTLAFAGLTGFLFLVPSWFMSLCYAAQIPIGLASKIPQIRENYRNKSTGQLSLFAVLNYFFGTVARTFTTWTEIHDDLIMLGGNLLASILNGVLVLQMAIYWRDTKRKVSMQKLQ